MCRNFRLICACLVGLMLVGCAADGGSTGVQTEATRTPAQQRVERGEQYIDQGRLDAALVEFGLALEENPRLTRAHLGMGHVFRLRERYELAGRAYQRAADTDPNSFDAFYYLGLVRQLTDQTSLAVESYRRALAILPDDPKANREIASAYLQLGQTQQALHYARRSIRLDPDSQTAWCNLAATYNMIGEHELAVDCYREAAELGDLADPVFPGLADAHLKLGNYQRAINVLHALIAREPSAIAYERLGYAQFRRRMFTDSHWSYSKALELDPNDTSSLNGLGATLMTLYIQSGSRKKDMRDEALKAWRRSVQINPRQGKIIDLISRYSRS